MSIIGEAFVRISPESAEFAEKTKGQLTSALGGLGPAVGVAAAVGIVAALGEVGEKFAEARHQIEQETGATGKALDSLFGQVKKTFADVPASLHDVTTAVDELSRRGVPAGHTLDELAKQELFLAKVTKEDLGTTVEQTTGLLAKFNVPLKDQSRELDVLFKGQQKSGKGLSDLVTGLTTGGAALGAFGFNLDESIALLSGFERSGISVGPVLAGLKKAFGTLVKSGSTDPKKDLEDMFRELQSGKDRTKATADALKLFGQRSGLELVRAVQSGKLNVHELLKEITDGKDGIVATGQATESLGDKIKLFRNQALVDIEPIGTAILDTFEKGVEEAAPVLQHLGTAVAGLLEVILPAVAPVGAALVGAFKVALPVIDTLATGIDTIASILGHVPGPALAVAGAAGALAFGLYNVGGATGVAVLGLEAFETAVAFATGPVGITLEVLGALGIAAHLFGSEASGAEKEAKDLGKALFDAGGDGKVFATGVSSAAEGFAKFLNQQISAGKDKSLEDLLHRSGQSVDDLVGNLDKGGAAWSKFAQGVAESAGKSKVHISDLDKQIAAQEPGIALTGPLAKRAEAVGKYTDELNKQRDAFDDSARSELRFVAASGQLDQKQVDAIVRQHKLSDGTVDYGAVLDDVQRKLSDLSVVQNANAEATASTSGQYRELVDQLASGQITAEDAGAALAGFGFDAEGAKAKVSDLQSQIKSFLSAVSGSLPSVADAAKDFGSKLTSDTQQFTTDVQKHAQLLQQAAQAGGAASTALKDSIVSNNADIKNDYKALVADSDPQKFTDQIKKQAVDAAVFFQSIKTLVSEGFGALAGQLLQLGPQAGASLAAGLAGDKTKAEQANGAATFLNNQNAAITAYAAAHEAELTGTGADVGKKVVAGIAGGIAGGAGKVAESVRTATGRAAFPDPVTTQKFADFGAGLGGALVDGIVTGLSGQTFKIIGATKAQADIVRASLDKNYAVQSPSKITERIGRFLGLGLASGLQQGTPVAVAASAAFAQQTIDALTAHTKKAASTPVVIPFLAHLAPAPTVAPVPKAKPKPLTEDQIAAIKFIGSDQVQKLLKGLGDLKPPPPTKPEELAKALRPAPTTTTPRTVPVEQFLKALKPPAPPTADAKPGDFLKALRTFTPPPPKKESGDFLKALRPPTPPAPAKESGDFLRTLRPPAPPTPAPSQADLKKFFDALANHPASPIKPTPATPAAPAFQPSSLSQPVQDALLVAVKVLDAEVARLNGSVATLARVIQAKSSAAERPIQVDARGHANPRLLAAEIAFLIG